MHAMLTRFRPHRTLSRAEVGRLVAQRKRIYTDMPGLRWKAWIRDPATGEYGAFYVWEDESTMRNFLRSDLWRSLPGVHGVTPKLEIFEVMDVLERKG